MPAPAACSSSSFEVLHPPLTTSTIEDLWGTAADDVWAVGHDGLILVSHDRGSTWRVQRDGLAAAVHVVKLQIGVQRLGMADSAPDATAEKQFLATHRGFTQFAVHQVRARHGH